MKKTENRVQGFHPKSGQWMSCKVGKPFRLKYEPKGIYPLEKIRKSSHWISQYRSFCSKRSTRCEAKRRVFSRRKPGSRQFVPQRKVRSSPKSRQFVPRESQKKRRLKKKRKGKGKAIKLEKKEDVKKEEKVPSSEPLTIHGFVVPHSNSLPEYLSPAMLIRATRPRFYVKPQPQGFGRIPGNPFDDLYRRSVKVSLPVVPTSVIPPIVGSNLIAAIIPSGEGKTYLSKNDQYYFDFDNSASLPKIKKTVKKGEAELVIDVTDWSAMGDKVLLVRSLEFVPDGFDVVGAFAMCNCMERHPHVDKLKLEISGSVRFNRADRVSLPIGTVCCSEFEMRKYEIQKALRFKTKYFDRYYSNLQKKRREEERPKEETPKPKEPLAPPQDSGSNVNKTAEESLRNIIVSATKTKSTFDRFKDLFS